MFDKYYRNVILFCGHISRLMSMIHISLIFQGNIRLLLNQKQPRETETVRNFKARLHGTSFYINILIL